MSHRDSCVARPAKGPVGCGNAPPRWRLIPRWATWLFALAFPVFGQAAGDAIPYVELSGGFKSGDFGTAVRSDLYYVAPTVGYVTTNRDFAVTVPYLRLAASGSTETGVGDIVARAGTALWASVSDTYSFYGALALKLPTADDAKGLGTGETDIGGFLSVRRPLGQLRLNLQGGYIKTGLGDASGMRDVALYSAGLSGTTEHAHWYLSLDGRTPLVHGAQAPLEVGAGTLYALGRKHFVRGSAFAGLNEGGPAFGVALGFVRAF